MLNKLKAFAAASGRYDIDDLVELSAYGRALRAEYEALNAEVPDWLDAQSKAVRREIKERQQDVLAARIRSARSRLDALKTPAEQRESLQAELKRLEELATV